MHQKSEIISTTPDAGALLDEAEELLDEHAPCEVRSIIVPAQQHGQRLDRALTGLVPEFSRSYWQQQIESGQVQLNGQSVTKPSTMVQAGKTLRVELKPTPQSQAFQPEPMDLEVVYEDAFLLVVNKPAGLVVHPAPGNWRGTLLNGLLAHHAGARFLPRAGIVHRLDKDTSGLMVVAKQRETMDALVQMIANREVAREYMALAHGAWQGARNKQIDFAIGRDSRHRLRMAVVDLARQSGKTAFTHVSLIESLDDCCLVKCKLQTGRTHQIRVHLSAIGHPLVGDVLYGGKLAHTLTRQALHAYRLAFAHPATGALLALASPLPLDFRAAVVDLGLSYNENAPF